MKRTPLMMTLLLTTSALWASSQCLPKETTVIDAEVHCVDNGGISIGLADGDGIKVACMQDRQVRSLCGPDGQVTRLHAYTQWFNKLQQFQNNCAADGGTFSYQDPGFVEPQNENFCLQAVPEVGSNMFEEPLCNYRSTCPAVAVECDRPCREHTYAKLF